MTSRPGIILKSDFVTQRSATSKGFAGYTDYIEREEAFEKIEENILDTNNFSENLFQNYLGYMDRFDGSFSIESEKISEEEMKNIKKIFNKAQENNSVMWRDVISFDNEFLKKEKIYNEQIGYLDSQLLKKASRKMMDKFIEKDKLNDPYWIGSIHRNTDNIHIHFSTIEQNPSRKEKNFEGEVEQKGRRQQSTLDAMKTTFANDLGIFRENYIEIGESRDKTLKTLKDYDLFLDENYKVNKELEKNIEELISHLPKDWKKKVKRNHVSYKYLNQNEKRLVDNSVELLAKKNKKLGKEITAYHQLIDEQNEKLIDVFGEKYNPNKNFKSKRKKEIQERLGNAFLKNLETYQKVFNEEHSGHYNHVREGEEGREYQKRTKNKSNKFDFKPKKPTRNKSTDFVEYNPVEKMFWVSQRKAQYDLERNLQKIVYRKRQEDLEAYEEMIQSMEHQNQYGQEQSN